MGATHLGGSTAHYLALLAETATRLGRLPVPTMHTMCGGGAPKPPELYWRAQGSRPASPIRHGYGMTECPMISCGAVDDTDEQLASTDGAPVLNGCEVLVVDDDERAGRPRRSTARSWCGVRCSPRATSIPSRPARRSVPTGSSAPATAGIVRDDGHLVITGRSKEMIIRKGENISPREIEDVLSGTPGGRRGRRDRPARRRAGRARVRRRRTGNRRRGVVVRRDAAALPRRRPHDAEDPEQLEIVEMLPRNPTMKILKRVLVTQLTTEPTTGDTR